MNERQQDSSQDKEWKEEEDTTDYCDECGAREPHRCVNCDMCLECHAGSGGYCYLHDD